MHNTRKFVFDTRSRSIINADDDRLEILKFKNEEVHRLPNGEIELDSSDALERMFWELDFISLERLKDDFKVKLKGNKNVLFSLVQQIDKVIVQRKFMQENKAMRYALLPE